MTRIIGISGRKQSGKSTAANYINGDILSLRDMVKDFSLSDDGKLLINTTMADGSETVGEFDVCRRDQDFIAYAEKEMWPYVKVYHFADTLKNMCVELFGIQPRQVFGTDDDKNEETNYHWEDMPTDTDGKTGVMTSREFLQYFGTSVVRSINTNAWVQATIKRITDQNTNVAIIPDVRFPNEVQAIKHAGGTVIRMERNPFDCSHACESALDRDKFDWNEFDVIIPNTAITIPMLVEELSNISHLWR